MQEISPLSRRWSMEKERIRELLWCHDGTQRGRWNLWTYRSLYFITAFKSFKTRNVNLYRDNGLILLRNPNGQLSDRIRKNAIKLFKDIGFKIAIEANLKLVNFLDATLNLANSTYKPYRKPNDNLLYIHYSSNHSPQNIKHLPDSIEERLSNNFSNKQVFNSAKPEYEKSLKR